MVIEMSLLWKYIIQRGNTGLKSYAKSKYVQYFSVGPIEDHCVSLQCFESHEPFQIKINCLSESGHDGNIFLIMCAIGILQVDE